MAYTTAFLMLDGSVRVEGEGKVASYAKERSGRLTFEEEVRLLFALNPAAHFTPHARKRAGLPHETPDQREARQAARPPGGPRPQIAAWNRKRSPILSPARAGAYA